MNTIIFLFNNDDIQKRHLYKHLNLGCDLTIIRYNYLPIQLAKTTEIDTTDIFLEGHLAEYIKI